MIAAVNVKREIRPTAAHLPDREKEKKGEEREKLRRREFFCSASELSRFAITDLKRSTSSSFGDAIVSEKERSNLRMKKKRSFF